MLLFLHYLFSFSGYPVPGTSTPLRPHNLPNNLKNSMGQLGSSSSLPRSRTPKKRHSDESHQSDDLSSNSTETPPDTSLPDKPVFHLDKYVMFNFILKE